MIIINEWKNKEYVTRWYYSIELVGFNEFDEETQELIKKIVLEDEQASNKTDEIQKYIQKYTEYYKNKGYSDDDIKVVKIYLVGLDDDKLIYEVKLKVLTEHSEFCEYIIADKEVKLTSKEFNKERNELGEKIKNKVEIIKLRKENEELKQKIKELEEELKKYKDDEDEDEDDE